MDHARSTISKIFNGEPRSYTRFNLTQNMEGENSQVEMKLSSDMDEEVGNSTENHCSRNNNHREAYTLKAQRNPRNVCVVVICILLVFIIGYLIGYLAHYKQDKMSSTSCASNSLDGEEEKEPLAERKAEPTLDWNDLKRLLGEKFTADGFDASFGEFCSDEHEAGSGGDEALAERMLKRFKGYGLQAWTDQHFVKLQGPPVYGSNRITMGGEVIGMPRGYLAYSANGTKEGKILYAHYGEEADFRYLQDVKFSLEGSVVLIRAGKISFAEKVANAVKVRAAAVLIYPDPADYDFSFDTELYGHVHLGSGDPYTPGFPSFNHTQFPPAQSLGLPSILAQTITASMAIKLFKGMSGPESPRIWKEGRLPGIIYKLGENETVGVEVNNVLVEKKIYNVFGVIKGSVDADRYLVIGAQRDSWGPGFAKSTVGTSLLAELARGFTDMIKNDGFTPKRSIVFASWSAGEYGSVGATEWLEGYLSSLNLKAFTYINLDGAITGYQTFKASASPLLYSLVQSTLNEVKSPFGYGGGSLYSQVAGANWEKEVMVSMKMDDSAYPFMVFSGIPSVSFRFAGTGDSDYKYFGTMLDTKDKLQSQASQFAVSAAQVAGQMALRLVHDHLLRLDVSMYSSKIRTYVSNVNRLLKELTTAGTLPKTLTSQWLISAYGSYSRASTALINEIGRSDLSDAQMCRNLNDRIMRVEKNLLSPYVSPKESPFRHIIFGSGSHTLAALVEHLEALRAKAQSSDVDLFQNQFALATWTIQGCSNALAGNIWALDNQI